VPLGDDAGAAAAPVVVVTLCPDAAAPQAPQNPEPALSWAPHFAQNAIDPLSPSGMFLLVEDFFAQQLSLSWPRMKENLLLNSLEFLPFLC
jgi:hypothetical protein